MRKLLKIVLLTPLIGFGAPVVLRGCMVLMQPTHEQIRRDTQARTLAYAVCNADACTGARPALVTQMMRRQRDQYPTETLRTYFAAD